MVGEVMEGSEHLVAAEAIELPGVGVLLPILVLDEVILAAEGLVAGGALEWFLG